MAKLSARGRKEVVRFENLQVVTDPESLVSERRYTVAFMSDHTLLKKIDVVFKSDGKKHSYGWKKIGKAKPTHTAMTLEAFYKKLGYVRA